MTDDERQVLEDTARLLLHSIEEQKGTVAGMEVALLELYRAQFTTDERKYETMVRLKMSLTVSDVDGPPEAGPLATAHLIEAKLTALQ